MNELVRTELNNYKYQHFLSHTAREENQEGDSHMTTDHRSQPRNPRLTIAQKNDILTHFKDHGLNGQEIHEVTKIPYHQITTYLKTVKSRRGGIGKEQRTLVKKIAKENNGRKSRTAVDDETLQKMIAMWDGGNHNYTLIGDMFGIADVTAAKYLKEAGRYREGQVAEHKKAEKNPKRGLSTKGKHNRQPPTQAQVDEMIRMYKTGKYSFIQIAKATGVAPATAERYAKGQRTLPAYSKTKPTSSTQATPIKVNTGSLIEELKAEIRAEIKEALLKEMLGK
jgi:hypothetical protein